MDKIVNVVEPNFRRLTKNALSQNAYAYFERNKDFLCRVYNLDFYNPTDMERAYMKYLLRHRERGDRYLIDEHNKPAYVINFIQSLNGVIPQ